MPQQAPHQSPLPPHPPQQSSGSSSAVRRAHHFKVKTGCATCKIRKIKCDETKPFCRRCTSTGRKCDGYKQQRDADDPRAQRQQLATGTANGPSEQQNVIVSQNLPAMPSESTANATNAPDMLAQPSSFPDLNLVQHRTQGLEFFNLRTMKELSSFFEGHIWNRIIMPVAQSEPALSQALIALGMCHMRFSTGTLSKPLVIEQYNAAVRALTMRLQRAGEHVSVIAMISCLIFIAVESMSGRPAAVHHHIRTGLAIANDSRRRITGGDSATQASSASSNVALSVEDVLADKFARLEACTSFYQDRSPTVARLPGFPPQFTNLAGAQRDLSILMSEVYAFKRPNPLRPASPDADSPTTIASEARRTELFDHVRDWQQAMDSCIPSMTTADPSSQTQQAILTLQIQAQLLLVVVQAAHHRQTIFDTLYSDLSRIVELTEQLQPLQSAAGLPGVSLDTSVVPALTQVSLKCRDPHLRRRSADLLRDMQQHGLWDYTTAYRVAIKAMELEEAAAGVEVTSAADVPEDKRWNEVHLTAEADSPIGTLRCERFLDDGDIYVENHPIELGIT